MFTDEAIKAAMPAVLDLLLKDGFTGAVIIGAERCDADPECARFYWYWNHPNGPQERNRVFHMDDFA